MSKRPARIDHAFVKVLEDAKHSAAKHGQRYVTIEHVLRATMRDHKTIFLFEEFGLNVRDMNQWLIDEINMDQPRRKPLNVKELVIHDELQKMLDLIGPVKKVYGLDDSVLDIAGFYMTILDNYEGPATELLRQCGFTGGDVSDFAVQNPPPPSPPSANQNFSNAANDPKAPSADQAKKTTTTTTTTTKKKEKLPSYLVDLNEAAGKGKIDPIIGREFEIEQAVETLARRKKNNPMFVGEPGVGKTAIAEGLAKRIADGNVPESLKDKIIYSLNLGGMTAGTKYRGEFEERLEEVIAMVKKDPNAILFIDEIHQLIGAGKSGGSMDAANIMKPALQNGDLRCMGATTYKEYRNQIEKDGAMSRRFQKIDVKEPTQAEAISILKGAIGAYETTHGVKYSEEAIEAAVTLSVKYLTQQRLPDKAFDVIDIAGARQKVASSEKRLEIVDVREIEKVVARMARRPDATVTSDESAALAGLEDEILKHVYHQNAAVKAVVNAVHVSRAGLQSPDKPVGSYLFTGPTGVGKTEVAKQLANALGMELKRFDMSEYMEKHTVSRLIGAPPGYVGYDQGGLLTDAVDRTPSCVVLLDEIEKAHKDVYNILLQVMDNGALTDNNGKKIDFRNVILIMTSNVGAGAKVANSTGISKQANNTDEAYTAAVNENFTPEFRNRLDATIKFDELSKPAVRMVTDKFVQVVVDLAAEKQVDLQLTDGVRDWLASKGYNREMGARPMGRVIHEHIKNVLAPKMLFGELKNGGEAKFSFNMEAKATESPLVLEVKAKPVARGESAALQRQRAPA